MQGVNVYVRGKKRVCVREICVLYANVWVRGSVYMYKSVCVCERERHRVCVMCACVGKECVCMYMCVLECTPI